MGSGWGAEGRRSPDHSHGLAVGKHPRSPSQRYRCKPREGKSQLMLPSWPMAEGEPRTPDPPGGVPRRVSCAEIETLSSRSSCGKQCWETEAEGRGLGHTGQQ